MTRSGSRTMLVALGVLAVALGGALFPTTGFGSAPASETDLVGPSGHETGPSTSDQAGPVTAQSAPPDSGSTTTVGADATTPTATDSGNGGASTDSPTPEPTATPTEPPSDRGSAGDGGGLGGLALGFLLVAVVGLALVPAAVWRFTGSERRSDGSPGGVLGRLPLLGRFVGRSPVALAARIPQVTMVALVGVSTGTTRVLGAAGSLASDVADGLAVVASAGSRSAATGITAGLSGLFSLPSGPSFSLSGVLSGLSSGGSSATTGAAPTDDARAEAAIEPDSGEERTVLETIDDAWAAFTEPLPVADPEARTPGEFARLAVERGDPPDPVRRLTRVFRDVRYGGLPPTDERTRSAIEAVREIDDDRDGRDDA